jgi:hypothetical protein
MDSFFKSFFRKFRKLIERRKSIVVALKFLKICIDATRQSNQYITGAFPGSNYQCDRWCVVFYDFITQNQAENKSEKMPQCQVDLVSYLKKSE